MGYATAKLLTAWNMSPLCCSRKVCDTAGTVYPKKYAHGFVVLCFVVVMQSFIMNSYEVFIHIHQGCFAGTGAIVRLPQCQWSKPDGYGKISQCITTTKQQPCAYFLGYTVLPLFIARATTLATYYISIQHWCNILKYFEVQRRHITRNRSYHSWT